MFKIIYRGNSSGNLGIHPTYHFCHFPSKNDNLGLKMKILKILGIQPINLMKTVMEPGPCTMIGVFHASTPANMCTAHHFTVFDNVFITFPFLCTDTIMIIIECKFGW